jgi:dephospho-CoA kinase
MIIGVAGHFGAGKDVVVEYLKTKGFTHYSTREFLRKEIDRRGLIPDRDAFRRMGRELREENGPLYIIKSLYEQAVEASGNAVISSIPIVKGAEFIQEQRGIMIGVVAERSLRYERIHARKSETDFVTYEEWCRQEDLESSDTDPTHQNIPGVLAHADYTLVNNGTLEELHTQIDAVLLKLTTKSA